MRIFFSVFVVALPGCIGVQEPAELVTGGTGGQGGFLDVADECPCVDLGSFEGFSVFTDPGMPCADGTAEGITVHAELIKPDPTHTCSACSCSDAECALPDGMFANPVKCSDADGSMQFPYGPSAGWTGECSTEGALPAGVAQSVTVPALPVTACAPSGAELSSVPPAWGRRLRECRSTSPESCGEGRACEPFAPEGALVCFYRHGLHTGCPAGYERLLFYEGVNDTRACEACTCDPLTSAACDAIVVLSSDATCSTMVGSVMATTELPGCVDLTGTALASTEAYFMTQEPGTCASGGGKPTGDVEPAEPVTLCCKSATVLQ